ncbi:MAG: hydrolase, partial [Nocardioides sp.]|uniref:alpha/beta hydrolase family protein n=1 Tax=Nocardioides sp. TaxID=35761 RepID=UPI0039E6578B
GARSAARTARALGAAGCLCLAFPLHPPGRPEKSRAEELTGTKVPTLVVQGARDPMGRPEEFPAGTDLVVVPGADHSLRVGARAGVSAEDVAAIVVESVLEWLTREVIGTTSGPVSGPMAT